jgi:hypothetical protein
MRPTCGCLEEIKIKPFTTGGTGEHGGAGCYRITFRFVFHFSFFTSFVFCLSSCLSNILSFRVMVRRSGV